MPFPAIKLVSLFLKQLSKPLAGYIKRQAQEHRLVRTYICIPPAQVIHRAEMRLKMWSAGSKRSKDFKIKPLSEEEAIKQGADLLGELVIFVFGAGVIAMEYWRQAVNAALKEQKQDDSLVRLRKDINNLMQTVDSRQDQIDRLTFILENQQSKDFKLVKVDPKTDPKNNKPK